MLLNMTDPCCTDVARFVYFAFCGARVTQSKMCQSCSCLVWMIPNHWWATLSTIIFDQGKWLYSRFTLALSCISLIATPATLPFTIATKSAILALVLFLAGLDITIRHFCCWIFLQDFTYCSGVDLLRAVLMPLLPTRACRIIPIPHPVSRVLRWLTPIRI